MRFGYLSSVEMTVWSLRVQICMARIDAYNFLALELRV